MTPAVAPTTPDPAVAPTTPDPAGTDHAGPRRRTDWLVPRAAYVHIPFCTHHCGYCDFAVVVGRDHQHALYLEALQAELAALGPPRPVQSIFIGGGTPTVLSADHLAWLLDLLNRQFPHDGQAEVTIESTPDSLTAEKVAVLRAGGVNRVSIGVQSFAASALRLLDRQHRSEQVPQVVAMVRQQIPAVSLDLIFGVPEQSLADWQADLEAALALEPVHLSTYGLTYEKGTPLWKRRQRGQVRPIDEELELAQYVWAMDRLEAAGFVHYEISNFARPGYESRHNHVYWANEAYFGVGLGAARYVNGVREVNTRDFDRYVRCCLCGEPATFQREQLDPEARARETITTQLRRASGIDRTRFAEQTGFSFDQLAGPRYAHLLAAGLLHDDGQSVRLTRAGRCVADSVALEFLAAS
jgi:oxygen-independent coproporphyrinogen-3 oxidase